MKKILSKKNCDMLSPYTAGKVFLMRAIEPFYDEKLEATYDIESSYYQCEDTTGEFTTGEQDDEWLNNVYAERRRYKLEKLGI